MCEDFHEIIDIFCFLYFIFPTLPLVRIWMLKQPSSLIVSLLNYLPAGRVAMLYCVLAAILQYADYTGFLYLTNMICLTSREIQEWSSLLNQRAQIQCEVLRQICTEWFDYFFFSRTFGVHWFEMWKTWWRIRRKWRGLFGAKTTFLSLPSSSPLEGREQGPASSRSQ